MDIENRTKESGKTYQFDDAHNPSEPAQYWFQNPPDGLTLFVVFYTQACRWSKCLGCNLPSKMSTNHISFKHIMAQIDFLFDHIITAEQKRTLKKIILSNNGSVLDEKTFSTTSLIYFVAKMNLCCPEVSTLCLETRPEYIDWQELEILSRALREGDTPTDLEIAIGFEAFDDKIRNEFFHKGMLLESFEKMADLLAQYKFKLKTYFMMKPVPDISEEEGVQDIINAIAYLDAIAKKYSLAINMHLNPTYVASGTELEKAFNRGVYQPPQLESICQALLFAEQSCISIYVGLNDEGLAVPGGSFIRENDDKLLQILEQFNKNQDYHIIKNR